jgi:hypothetical protein
MSLIAEIRAPPAGAVTAGALQTTIGEGLLTAAAHGSTLVADAFSSAATWPVFGRR